MDSLSKISAVKVCMKRIILIYLLALIGTSFAFAWGYEVIAGIAENNLKPRIKTKMESYLSHSIVYYAKWMDNLTAEITHVLRPSV